MMHRAFGAHAADMDLTAGALLAHQKSSATAS